MLVVGSPKSYWWSLRVVQASIADLLLLAEVGTAGFSPLERHGRHCGLQGSCCPLDPGKPDW